MSKGKKFFPVSAPGSQVCIQVIQLIINTILNLIHYYYYTVVVYKQSLSQLLYTKSQFQKKLSLPIYLYLYY
jgi:hypothetical protein